MEQLLVAEPGTIEVGEVEQSALDLGKIGEIIVYLFRTLMVI